MRCGPGGGSGLSHTDILESSSVRETPSLWALPFPACSFASRSQHISRATVVKVDQDESPRSSRTPEALCLLTIAFRVKQTPVHGLSPQRDLTPARLYLPRGHVLRAPGLGASEHQASLFSAMSACPCLVSASHVEEGKCLVFTGYLRSECGPWHVGVGGNCDRTRPICGYSPPPLNT